MKKITSRITTSLMSYLDEWLSDAEIENHITGIQQAMLDSMLEYLADESTWPITWRKIHFATSIETLWYLRSDLMTFLCENCGEVLAREKLAVITEKFRSVLPPDQMPITGPKQN